MARAEFEEREYEVAVAVQMSRPVGIGNYIFSAGTVLEKVLGYDAVAQADAHHEIWQVLGLARPPGVVLVPPHWGGGNRPQQQSLPTVPISLVFQYKRPDYMYGPSAKQWRLWQRPYFRFERTRRQQTVLHRLERSLGGRALVRYMSPAFWQRGQLEAACLNGTLLRRSGFVPPSVLNNHRYWTYIAPGRIGRANPDGEPRDFEDLTQLLSQLDGEQRIEAGSQELVSGDDALRTHLGLVGQAARTREPSIRIPVDRWIRAVRETVTSLEADTIEAIRDVASITSLMSAVGGSWWITSAEISQQWKQVPDR